MTGGTGPAESDPWLAADALREIAQARRAAAGLGRPSPWPRAVQALALGAPLALLAGPATAWTPYLIIGVAIVGPGLSRRMAGGRVRLNGFWIRGHAWPRAGAAVTLLAVIALTAAGKVLWHWPAWTPLAGGALVAALCYGISRWFDLRLWQDWGQR